MECTHSDMVVRALRGGAGRLLTPSGFGWGQWRPHSCNPGLGYTCTVRHEEEMPLGEARRGVCVLPYPSLRFMSLEGKLLILFKHHLWVFTEPQALLALYCYC